MFGVFDGEARPEDGFHGDILQKQILQLRLGQQGGVHHQVLAKVARLHMGRKSAESLTDIIPEFLNRGRSVRRIRQRGTHCGAQAHGQLGQHWKPVGILPLICLAGEQQKNQPADLRHEAGSALRLVAGVHLRKPVVKHAQLKKSVLQGRDEHMIQTHARDEPLIPLQLKQVVQQLKHHGERNRRRHASPSPYIIPDELAIIQIARVIHQPLVLPNLENPHERLPAKFRCLTRPVESGSLHCRVQSAASTQNMQLHEASDAIVKSQENNFVLRTRQFHRRTASSVRHGKAAELLKSFNHRKI